MRLSSSDSVGEGNGRVLSPVMKGRRGMMGWVVSPQATRVLEVEGVREHVEANQLGEQYQEGFEGIAGFEGLVQIIYIIIKHQYNIILGESDMTF